MTGDELFERMQNKEFGVILESLGDANELQSILKSAVRAIDNVDNITDWFANRNAHVVLADYCARAVLYAQSAHFNDWKKYYDIAIPFSQIFGTHLSISAIDDLL